jgi:hypothetical protein
MFYPIGDSRKLNQEAASLRKKINDRIIDITTEIHAVKYELHKRKAEEGCNCGNCIRTYIKPNGLVFCKCKNKYVLKFALCERHLK